ncbi:MAG: DUF4383 domain-containing protein [Parachlamydiaceae bacterium]|nr:DUF4383 domain-containing protein [Parachlamydiaceae bacterium]
MLRIFAIAMSFVFIIFGVLGFMPDFVANNKLFGIFAINTYHNLLHLCIGLLGLLCALNGIKSSRYFFISLGVAYGLIALIGLYDVSIALLRYIASNGADTWLSATIAAFSLYIAFSYSRKKTQRL